MHWLLLYDLAPDYLERRETHRAEHLRLANDAHRNRDLLLAGALPDPFDTALLLFTNEAAARAFAEEDPYVLHGLVTAWQIRKWNTVVGEGSTPP